MRFANLARCAIWTLLAGARVAVADTTVFINEIHYDNAGADLNEGIEIAGPAGTDLTGWKVVPYNGSGGTQYTPAPTLSVTLASTCGSYGVLSVPIAGLQNGNPDGIASRTAPMSFNSSVGEVPSSRRMVPPQA